MDTIALVAAVLVTGHVSVLFLGKAAVAYRAVRRIARYGEDPTRFGGLVRSEGNVRMLESFEHPVDRSSCCCWVEREYSGRWSRGGNQVNWGLPEERLEHRPFLLETPEGLVCVDIGSLAKATLDVCDHDFSATRREELEVVPAAYRAHFRALPRRLQTGALRENDTVLVYGSSRRPPTPTEGTGTVTSTGYRVAANPPRYIAELTRADLASSGVFKGTYADFTSRCRAEAWTDAAWGLGSLAIGAALVYLFS
jgi:hypothetical protein